MLEWMFADTRVSSVMFLGQYGEILFSMKGALCARYMV